MSKQNFSSKRGPASYHATEQAVRASLGLTQQELAWLLGVSRSALSMAERGRRTLPLPALQRLLQLWQAITQPAPVAPGSVQPAPVLTADQRDLLDLRCLGINLEEYPLRQQVKRAQVRLEQARQRQQAALVLHALTPTGDELAQRWLTRFEAEALTNLHDDAATVALLELRLRVLAFEQAEIEQLLSNVEIDKTTAPRSRPA